MTEELRPDLSVTDDDQTPDASENTTPYANDEGVNIGVIGFPRSGKTMTLLTLDRALGNPRWKILPNLRTSALLEELNEKYVRWGKFPPPSLVKTTLEFYVERRGDRLGFVEGTYPPMKMKVLDAPGSAFLRTDHDYDEDALRYIATCSGIIFLIDPEHEWAPKQNKEATDSTPKVAKQGVVENEKSTDKTPNVTDDYLRARDITADEFVARRQEIYRSAFTSMFNRIDSFRRQSDTQLPTNGIYVAFCLTKMDERSMSPVDGRAVKDIAETIIGPMAMRRINDFCRGPHIQYRWRSTSAIGMRKSENEENAIVSRYDKDAKKIINPGNIQPEGIRETMEWLLDAIYDDVNRGSFLARWRARFRR